jgi:hypothetical protein
MPNDAEVRVPITGDNGPLKAALADTTNSIKAESAKWDKDIDDSSGNISGSLIGAFTAVTASAAFLKIGRMLADFGLQSVAVASDLEEVQNVVDVTFGEEGSATVEAWAKRATSAFGLTELQAKQYASTMGAMMKSNGLAKEEVLEMSMDLAGLAADMASFYNMPFDEAFNKIQSGMAGITMPLRQLGIDMTEGAVGAYALANGFETAYSNMSEAEQMLVRYQYLMSVTADAQGDFTRTSDSYANSQRRVATGFETLKAQIGEMLLPMATEISNAVADLLGILTYQPPDTMFDVAEESMSDAVETATQAQGILGYMQQLYEKYGEVAESTEEWATALESLKKVMPEVNQFIDSETGALTATNEQLREYIENRKQAAIEGAKQSALAGLSDQYVQANQDYYTAEIRRDMAQAQANEAWSALVSYIRSKPGQGDYTGEGASLKQLETAAYSLANEYGDSKSTIRDLVAIYKEQTKEADTQAKKMEELSNTIDSAKSALDIASQALDRMSSAAQSANSALSSIQAPSVNMSSGQYYNWKYMNGSHAGGLDFVPFDGYIAQLHQGEAVLKADDAARWRSGQGETVQVHTTLMLDGRAVGESISVHQAEALTSLERSGVI